MVPYLILTEYFDSVRDAFSLNVWVSLIGLGNVGSILIVGFLIAEIGWRYALSLWVFLYLFSSLIMKFFIK